MRIYSKTLRHLVSTRKFYEIVNERKERNLPKTAEEFIISKFLKDTPSPPPAIKQSRVVNQELALKKSKQINYQQFLRENPNGSIITEQYKDVELSLVSLNYLNINLPEIHQICEKINPDLIFVQARPEAYLNHFQLLPKSFDVFSDRQYLQQISLNHYDINNYILSEEITKKLQHMLGKNANEADKVFIRDNKDIVEDEVLMISSYFADANKKTLMLGELPQQPWREWLCNSHTLMELTEIFKHITKNIPFYQSLNISPYKLGALLKPELFLNIRDRYMATLLQMAIATKKYKKILCLTGLLQNQAIQQILLNESLLKPQGQSHQFTPVIQYLIGPQIKHSILRNTQGWQIIQKHILLDVLHYGDEVVNQPILTFATTNKVIAHYGRANDYPEQQLMRFRYDKTMGYLSLMREQVREGRELKRKFLLRQAMRSADL